MRSSRSPPPGLALAAVLAPVAAGLLLVALAESAAPPVPPLGGPALVPDVNRSPQRHLLLLPGIGPVRAAQIAAEREARGPFADLADLQRVRGIGPLTVRRLEGAATATGRRAPSSGREPPDPPGGGPSAGAR